MRTVVASKRLIKESHTSNLIHVKCHPTEVFMTASECRCVNDFVGVCIVNWGVVEIQTDK